MEEGFIRVSVYITVAAMVLFTLAIIIKGMRGVLRYGMDHEYSTNDLMNQNILVDKNTNADIALDEYRRLQGFSTSDAVRASINDMNTANKIASDVTGDTALLVAAHYKPNDLIRDNNGNLQLHTEGVDGEEALFQNRALVEAKMRGRIFRTDDTSDDHLLYSASVLLSDVAARREFNNIIWPSKNILAKKQWLQEVDNHQIPQILDQRNILDAISIAQEGLADKRLNSFYVRALHDLQDSSALDKLMLDMPGSKKEKFRNERFILKQLKAGTGRTADFAALISTNTSPTPEQVAYEATRRHLENTTGPKLMTTFVELSGILRKENDVDIKSYSDDVYGFVWFSIMQAIHGSRITDPKQVFLQTAPTIFNLNDRNGLLQTLDDSVRNYMLDELWLKAAGSPSVNLYTEGGIKNLHRAFDLVILQYLESIEQNRMVLLTNYVLKVYRKNMITSDTPLDYPNSLEALYISHKRSTQDELFNVLINESRVIMPEYGDLVSKNLYIALVQIVMTNYVKTNRGDKLDLLLTKLENVYNRGGPLTLKDFDGDTPIYFALTESSIRKDVIKAEYKRWLKFHETSAFYIYLNKSSGFHPN